MVYKLGKDELHRAPVVALRTYIAKEMEEIETDY